MEVDLHLRPSMTATRSLRHKTKSDALSEEASATPAEPQGLGMQGCCPTHAKDHECPTQLLFAQTPFARYACVLQRWH